jgi:hypothetical protein
MFNFNPNVSIIAVTAPSPTMKFCEKELSSCRVTTCTQTHNSWLHFVAHCYIHTRAHARTLVSSPLVTASNGGLFLSSGFLYLSRASSYVAISGSGTVSYLRSYCKQRLCLVACFAIASQQRLYMPHGPPTGLPPFLHFRGPPPPVTRLSGRLPQPLPLPQP